MTESPNTDDRSAALVPVPGTTTEQSVLICELLPCSMLRVITEAKSCKASVELEMDTRTSLLLTSRPQPLLLTLQKKKKKKKPQTLCILFFVFSPSCIFQAEDNCFCFWRRSPCRFESVSSSSLVVLSSRVMCST